MDPVKSAPSQKSNPNSPRPTPHSPDTVCAHCRGTEPHLLFFSRAANGSTGNTKTNHNGGAQRSRSAPRTKKETHGWPDTPRRALRYVRSWPPRMHITNPIGMDVDFHAINLIRNLCGPPNTQVDLGIVPPVYPGCVHLPIRLGSSHCLGSPTRRPPAAPPTVANHHHPSHR